MIRFDYNRIPDHKTRPMADYALSTVTGLKHGYLCAEYVARNGIAGVVVECGVAAGAQVGTMSKALSDNRCDKEIHLFDSFEGIPMAGIHDIDQPGIGKPSHDTSAPIEHRLVSSGVSSVSADNVKANLARFGVQQKVHYHVGWFQNTIPRLSDFQNIALLRLDGDLYESTEVCLRHLYPLVSKGGVVIIDDYALAGCKKAVDEYRAEHCQGTEMHVENVGGGALIATWVKW